MAASNIFGDTGKKGARMAGEMNFANPRAGQGGNISLGIEAEIMRRDMASADGFPERVQATPIYKERFLVAFPAGHPLGELDSVPIAAVNGENYLDRVNCEYQYRIGDLMDGCGCSVKVVYQSEREDWIQNMPSVAMNGGILV